MKSLRGWRVFFACGVLAAAVSAFGAPQRLAWIDVESQIQNVAPVPLNAPLAVVVEGLQTDSESSVPFCFSSVAPGLLILFR